VAVSRLSRVPARVATVFRSDVKARAPLARSV